MFKPNTLKLSFYLTLLLIFVCSIFVAFQKNDNRYRWSIKTLTDSVGVSLIHIPTDYTNIQSLIKIKKPAKKLLGKNRSQPEKRKVTIEAQIIGMAKEKDGDFHLIIRSVNTLDTMIAEIPNPEDEALVNYSVLKSLYSNARSFISNQLYYPKKKLTYIREPFQVSITGFLFFDKKNHGKGHAINGIEIHPVLAIEINN